MTAEFNVWLLLVGLVVGGALTWLVIGELRRSDADVGREERGLEADWIAAQLAGSEDAVTDAQADAVLRLHRRYLAISLPPEPSIEPDTLTAEPAEPTEPDTRTAEPAEPIEPPRSDPGGRDIEGQTQPPARRRTRRRARPAATPPTTEASAEPSPEAEASDRAG